jgi:hypothetical protein
MKKETFLRLATEEEAEKLKDLAFREKAIETAMRACTSVDAMRGIVEEETQYVKEHNNVWDEISKSLSYTLGEKKLSFSRITNGITLVEYIYEECEAKNE